MKNVDHNRVQSKASPENSGRVKQIDVANLAGVTRATVSRVLNNYTDKFSVRPEVRQRVLDAVSSLGYRPDLMAHTLRKKTKSGLVGWFGGISPVTFSANVRHVVTEALSVHNLLLSPIFATNADQPIQLPWWRMDAAVVLDVREQGNVQLFETANISYVCVNCICGPRGSSVQMDDAGGMRLACQHLLELGHRKIAFVIHETASPYEHFSVRIRRDSYLQAMCEAGVKPMEEKRFIDNADDLVQDVVIRQKATAILAYSCHTAILFLRALQQAGLQIPQDVSLIAFNDEYPLCHLSPAMTVVDLDGRAAGRVAAEMVINQLADPTLGPQHQVLPETLIVRESTASPRKKG